MDEIGDLVVALIGTPVRVVIAIGLLSLLVINIIWFANRRSAGLNLTQHLASVGIAALGGTVLLVGAAAANSEDEVCCDVGGGVVKMTSAATCQAPVDEQRCKEPDAMAAETVDALKAKAQDEKKVPDKPTKPPDEKPEKPTGVAKNDKEDPKVCCELGGDTYKQVLLSTCKKQVDAKKCEKKQKIVALNPDEPLKPFPKREDPDANPNAQTGAVTKPSGPPQTGSNDGFAAINSGHPYWRDVNADLHQNFKFPAIRETEKIAGGCFYFNPDGTIPGWRLIPPSNDQELDFAAEIALKAVQDLRNNHPKPLPDELAKKATTTWICFKLGNLKRES